MYKKVIVTKVPNRFNEPSRQVDIIRTYPTVNNSRASLLMLNEHYREKQARYWAYKLKIDVSGYKLSPKALLEVLREKFSTMFLQKKSQQGDLVCEYCTRKVYIRDNWRMPDSASVDHKIPLVDECDWFDENNLAVSCYVCNQEKQNIPYDEWKIIATKRYNDIQEKIKMARYIGEKINKITYTIFDTIANTTDVQRLEKIANIASESRNFLLKYLTDKHISVENGLDVKKDVEFLTKLDVVARHKAYPELDKKISVENEIKHFFHTCNKWHKIHFLYK